jgi:hypothetical protein
MYEDEDNDGRYPDESPVEARYPRSKQEEQSDREQWPWLPGTMVEQCGPDDWYVCVEVRELAVLRDGRRPPRGTASRNLYYLCCFRGRSEIRLRTASSGAGSAARARGGGNRDWGPSAVPGFLVPAGYGPSALFRVGRAVPAMMA